ncbi:MAG: LptF/LptG family permease [Gemmatimonadota bacterium]|nr:LptF/LptG family permease [Gemmatimonadota bacterium]
MRLLTRYLLRQLVAPFFFSLAALTGFMLLNQLAKKFGSLVGKGLEWTVIAEVFILSLPFIVAMTLPMAVLVAVLYSFTHLAADSEITAMRASGISVPQILRPILVWGVAMTLLNFVLVDQVLPHSNAALRALQIDIARKKPTFGLREQVINEIPQSQYFLRAGRVDPNSGRLRDVTIYDVGLQGTRRVIYADSGLMALAASGSDLALRLYDGSIHQYRGADPEGFQLTYFNVNDLRVAEVFDTLGRTEGNIVRGDREMGTCELLTVVRNSGQEAARARRDRRELTRSDLRQLVALPPVPSPRVSIEGLPSPPFWCGWTETLRELVLPETAEAQDSAQGTPLGAPGMAVPRRVPSGPTPAADAPALSSWTEVANVAERARDSQRRANKYLVEVHKKYSISFACLTFVILGLVLALRFPRGGMGLVIGGAMIVFALFYVGLTAGESLADRGIVSPAVAMWWPNVILTILGLIGLVRVNREVGSTRGGDLGEVFDTLKRRLGLARAQRRA